MTTAVQRRRWYPAGGLRRLFDAIPAGLVREPAGLFSRSPPHRLDSLPDERGGSPCLHEGRCRLDGAGTYPREPRCFTLEPMDQINLERWQAERIRDSIRPSVAYVRRLRARMEKRGF